MNSFLHVENMLAFIFNRLQLLSMVSNLLSSLAGANKLLNVPNALLFMCLT
jgi:hypothetical protein